MRVYSAFGKILNLLVQTLNVLGLIFIVVNGQIVNKIILPSGHTLMIIIWNMMKNIKYFIVVNGGRTSQVWGACIQYMDL